MAIGWITAFWVVAVPVGTAFIAAVFAGLSYNREQESLPLPAHVEAMFLWVLMLTVPLGALIAGVIALGRKNNRNSPNQQIHPIAGKPGSG